MDAHLRAIGSRWATIEFKNDRARQRAIELFRSFAGQDMRRREWVLTSDEAIDVAQALIDDGHRVGFN